MARTGGNSNQNDANAVRNAQSIADSAEQTARFSDDTARSLHRISREEERQLKIAESKRALALKEIKEKQQSAKEELEQAKKLEEKLTKRLEKEKRKGKDTKETEKALRDARKKELLAQNQLIRTKEAELEIETALLTSEEKRHQLKQRQEIIAGKQLSTEALYKQGLIGEMEYRQKILELQRQQQEVEEKIHEEKMKDLQAESAAISHNTDSYQDEFKARAKKINSANAEYKETLGNLKADFEAGKISEDEYNSKSAEAKQANIDILTTQYKDNPLMQGLGKVTDLLGGDGNGLISGISGAMGSLGTDLITEMAGPWGTAIKVLNTINSAVGAIRDSMGNYVKDAASLLAENMGKVDARLYGDTLGKSFSEMTLSVKSTIGASPYISQKELIQNIVKFTQAGIDYNIEQRALWDTLSERMVATFDAMDETLTRMILLQQSDITMAQMGIEAALTKLLNSTFKDNSYLNSLYDTVYSSILDASSIQNDTDQSTQFNYTVQKWLGALYSVGMSESTITSIANAINALGTGDLSELDSQTATLLQLSAVRGGLSYADLLTTGLDATSANTLLKNMVEYLRDIAENTSDNVILSEWGEVLNMQMSDWKAISNILDTDIATVSQSVMTQQTAEQETTDILNNLVAERTHLSSQISTAVENAFFSFGLAIASDEDQYRNWTIANYIDKFTETMQVEGLAKTLLDTIASAFSLGGIVKGIGAILNSISTAFRTEGLGNFMTSDLFSVTMNRGSGEIANSAEALEEGGGITSGTTTSGTVTTSISSSTPEIAASAQDEYDEWEDEDEWYEDEDTEESEAVETDQSDAEYTTFQNIENGTSATTENIYNEEGGLTRDISDLYSALFEEQAVPIKINWVTESGESLGQFFFDKVTSFDSRINGGTIPVSMDAGIFSSLLAMRE